LFIGPTTGNLEAPNQLTPSHEVRGMKLKVCS
jgi:hypothetical protein